MTPPFFPRPANGGFTGKKTPVAWLMLSYNCSAIIRRG